MIILTSSSVSNLTGVHPALARVVRKAAEISTAEFQVAEGLRTDAQQLKDWQRGRSKLNGIPKGANEGGIAGTGRGPHQVQKDGLGHAVDLVPYVDGQILWALPDAKQWTHIYPLADAMRAAAVIEAVRIRWGAVWDECLNDLTPGVPRIIDAVEDYKIRHAGVDFLDGPHFELEADWQVTPPAGASPLVA